MSPKTEIFGSIPSTQPQENKPSSSHWQERFAHEPADPKRGLRMIKKILPEEIAHADKASSHRPGKVTLLDIPDPFAEQDRTEARKAAQAEKAKNMAGWLRAGQALLEKMLLGEKMVRWDVAAQELGWTPEQGSNALRSIAGALKLRVDERLMTLRSDLEVGVINTQDGLQQETERLLALRDAKALLSTMEKL